jgi:hypothetical protein
MWVVTLEMLQVSSGGIELAAGFGEQLLLVGGKA